MGKSNQRVLDRIRVDRVHTAAQALELSSAAARSHFAHLWSPAEWVLRSLRLLPAGLQRYWLLQAGGHIVITHEPSQHVAGESVFNHQVLHNVAKVSAGDLVEAPLDAWASVGGMLDRLLGDTEPGHGLWLSDDGGGATTGLRNVGLRIQQLFELGYAFDDEAARHRRAYLARSLALYLIDRHHLNLRDPAMEKLLRGTILSNAFWRWQWKVELPAE